MADVLISRIYRSRCTAPNGVRLRCRKLPRKRPLSCRSAGPMLRLRPDRFRGVFDRELQPGNVLGGRAWRLVHHFALNSRPVGEFPRWADEMTSDCLSLFQQRCDRFAECPVQGARSVLCAYVNLRSCRLQLRDRDAAVDGDCRSVLGPGVRGKRPCQSENEDQSFHV